jgi:hypothetical protein
VQYCQLNVIMTDSALRYESCTVSVGTRRLIKFHANVYTCESDNFTCIKQLLLQNGRQYSTLWKILWGLNFRHVSTVSCLLTSVLTQHSYLIRRMSRLMYQQSHISTV